jgi:preprotein translocase subunit YajC
MVLTLGVGQHIMVKTGEKKLHGYIVKTDEHSFLIRPDLETDTVDIPYASIRKVHKNLSFGATVAILAGIAAAVVLILVLSGEDEADIVPG